MQTINHLPPIFREIKEISVLMNNGDTENYELGVAIDNLYKDQFITTTETAISRYESMLGITSKATESLENRRFRLLAMYNKQLPYTRTALERNLITLCGEDGYKLTYDYKNSLLIVKIALTAKSMFETVKSYLDGVIPMNLVIDVSLLYNQWLKYEQYTWADLEQYTWEQLREEVIC